MMNIKLIKPKLRNKILVLFALAFFPVTSFSQNIAYRVLSPGTDSVVQNGNLYVSISLLENKSFSTKNLTILIDKQLVNVNVKIVENRLSFLYLENLYDGLHTIEISFRTTDLDIEQKAEVKFYINRKTDQGEKVKRVYNSGDTTEPAFRLSGTIIADNRQQFLSGPGIGLRQEPSFTRTALVDLNGEYKDFQIPVRLFLTSNNTSQIQNRNFFMIGLKNRWLDVSYGDINPSMDKLVLTGVRVNGVKLALKTKRLHMQSYYGLLNTPREGALYAYLPGSGYIPPNLLNDSTYMVPGVYKRRILAGRFEFRTKRETFHIAGNASKVKDDIQSIQYGTSPKDNLVGGLDMSLRLFKKSLTLSGGFAGSVYTSDISYGVADKQQYDSAFKTNIPFEPIDYKQFIVLNSSTVPINPSIQDFTAYYGNVSFQKKTHSTSIEYRRNGPQYYSLANPFLRNNYEGILVSERVSLWKRKVHLSVNYNDFTNDLNSSLVSNIHTQMVFSSLLFTLGSKFPMLSINYLMQNRNSTEAIVSSANLDDRINTIGANLSYQFGKQSWRHSARLMFNSNRRQDFLRPETETKFYYGNIGWTESIGKKLMINASVGKTMLLNNANNTLSDINTYSGGVNWKYAKTKGLFSVSVSNTLSQYALYSNQTERFSLIVRNGIDLFKQFHADLEYGFQPFSDVSNELNNYQDQYAYFRFAYRFES